MSNITLNTIVYIGRGLLNGTATYVSGAGTSLARYVRKLTGRVNLGPDVSAVRWSGTVPIVPAEEAACPCPGEKPMRDTMYEIVVRMDARATAAHRTDVDLTIKDLVQKAEFTASVVDLAQPGG